MEYLNGQNTNETGAIELIYHTREDDRYSSPAFKHMVSLALPSIASNILTYLELPIMYAFIGHMSEKKTLVAVGFAITCLDIIIISVLYGFNNCMDTLMSQSANDAIRINSYLNKGRMTLFVISLFCWCILQLFPYFISQYYHKESIIDNLAKILPLFGIAGCMQAQYDLIKRFLIIKGKENIPILINSISIIVHIVMCYCIILIYDDDVVGAGVIFIITESINNVLIYVYIKVYLDVDMWWFDAGNIGDQDILKLSVFSISLNVIEFWSFDFVTILLSHLGKASINTNSILISTSEGFMQIFAGIASSATVLIGGCISTGNVRAAKRYFHYSIAFYLLVVTVALPSLYVYSYEFVCLYTSLKKVQNLFVETLHTSFIYTLFSDALQGTLSGSIRGLGLQNKAIYLVFVYWVWCVPVTYFVVYEWHLTILEEYEYFNVGTFVHSLGLLTILLCSNWEDICTRIVKDPQVELIEYEKESRYYSQYVSSVLM